jgi:hypothetical protein
VFSDGLDTAQRPQHTAYEAHLAERDGYFADASTSAGFVAMACQPTKSAAKIGGMKKLLLLFSVTALFAQAVTTVPPNIVLVMADDQGWGDMAYNGHPQVKTPNFDAMAKVGVRFDQFHAAAPVCSPTRGSVMTGRTPTCGLPHGALR